MSACLALDCTNETSGDDSFCSECRAIIAEQRAKPITRTKEKGLGNESLTRADMLARIVADVRREGKQTWWATQKFMETGSIGAAAFKGAVERGLELHRKDHL